ncbi:MAG: putative ABC exporter domain-containing protein [Phycisphaerae bacterium]|nr:putative ABC exporter domain-containing protein [Phycisphaerae bacterium]
MPLIPRSLLLLILLRLRASWHRAVRSLRTAKGIAFACVIGLMLLMALLAIVLNAFIKPPAPRPLPAIVTSLVPLGLMCILLLSMFRSPGERALVFLQAEVDLLFPAPVTRSQLLRYKLLQRVPAFLFSALFLSVWGVRQAPMWIAAFFGIFMTFWFFHLGALCIALLGQMFEQKRFAMARRIIAGGLLAAVATGAWIVRTPESPDSVLAALTTFAESPLGMAIAAPAIPFVRAAAAPHVWPDLALWGSIVIAINLTLLSLVGRLDSNWLEVGAESSQKLARRMDEFRRTGGFTASGGALSRVRLPLPPRLGGLGPLMWRQATTGVRQGGRTLIMLAVLIAAILLPRWLMGNDLPNGRPPRMSPITPMLGLLFGYSSLFVPQMMRLDFRGDIDRMDTLKSLPVAPLVVAAAQTLTPACLITALQALAAVAASRWIPLTTEQIAAWGAVLFMANVLIASVENGLFLLWPLRQARGAGMQAIGGQMFVQLVKMLLLGGCIVLAAVPAFITGMLRGDGSIAGVAVPLTLAAGLALESAVAIVIVGRLFARFDPSREQPPDA